MKNVSVASLLDTLIDKKIINQDFSDKLAKQQAKTKASIVPLLLDSNAITANKLAQIIAHESNLPLFDINKTNVLELPRNIIDAEILHQHNILPIKLEGSTLLLAITDPSITKILSEIAKREKLTLKPCIAEYPKLLTLLKKLAPLTSTNSQATTSTGKKARGLKLDNYSSELSDTQLDQVDLLLDDTDAVDTSDFPIVRFINKVILDSINKNASDIHFEPYENSYRVRMRIDGMLYEMAEPDVALAPRLAARLKVMARLDISERRIPQDGRFKLNLSKDKAIGFRVSTCPLLFGEKIVLRILDPEAIQTGIDGLGFEDEQKQLFLDTINKTQGMILVTGPTGSGKTVTLYTALSLLNGPNKNISTAEDPVEIYLSGINQVNINPKTGLDFAAVLRSFLRQDPDIIMVGEIRDKETSEIGIKAAQTGHLVLSTLHTNNAAETLTRLRNMGTDAYNIATSVNLVIAQRLVRCLCENCKRVDNLNRNILVNQGFNVNELANLKIYKATGCEQCTMGYKGRIGIFEVLPVTPEISNTIMNNGSSIDIYNKAIKEGLLNLRQAGLNKVRKGITSIEEINRVTE